MRGAVFFGGAQPPEINAPVFKTTPFEPEESFSDAGASVSETISGDRDPLLMAENGADVRTMSLHDISHQILRFRAGGHPASVIVSRETICHILFICKAALCRRFVLTVD